ncbi:MAG: VWA domain-containing protein [Candidatus Kerfeldbacteria bacterium]|nr:VWA domain-containing protein [Candidatus Kerfeldbacteria bacterium]
MQRFQRKLISALCLLTLMASIVATPLAARAQGIPVIDITNLTQQTSKQVFDTIGEVLKNAALVGIKNAMSAFLGKLAYDAAVFVASSGTGQQSLVYDQSVGDYLTDAGDAAAGGFIEGVATTAGLDAAGLCNPGDDFLINLTIGLETNIGAPTVYEPACTLTELAGNWEEAYSDPDFSKFVQLQFDSTANPLGISLEAQNLTIVAQSEAEKAAEIERQNSDFASKQEQISKTILTPASVIQDDLRGSKERVSDYSLQSLGNPVVDAINIFTSTLVAKLMERAQQGLVNLSSGSELSGLLGGEFSGTVSGRAAAEATYAELRQPIFASSGSFDVLSELVACPDEADIRSAINCTIGASLQTAIQDGWTVQEFVDYQSDAGQTFSFASVDSPVTTSQIQNSEGVLQTGVTVLKKYRVVPVGWQIAADYIANSSDVPTLEQLVNCYNYCGTADEERSCDFLFTDDTGTLTNYSPYCKLVDPFWVLKAPQNFCEREAPGEVIAEIENFDTDGNVNTQEDLVVSRLNYCADTRGCIQEEQEDVCTAYGYCTAEERIYRFDGDVCEPEYSSCETFTDTDGNDVSLVKSSLNYNDCATDPGCQWYCASQNDTEQFDCASPTETFVTCSEDVTTNESDYGLSYDVSYDANESCACTVEQTCQVPAGSTSGDSLDISAGLPGVSGSDGLTDYTECFVDNTDGSRSVCTLDDNCGASNTTYSEAAGTCTCAVTNEGNVELGDTSVSITVEDSGGADATETCELDDEDTATAGADSCSSDYSTYSNAPVCEVASAGIMNCGEVCYTETGGTCTNSLGNSCTDGASEDGDGDDGECLLSDSCSIFTGGFDCTSDSGNVCVLGTITEDPATANDTIYFDDNVQECDSGDAGCTQYIRIQPDTNLIANALFDYYDSDQNEVNDSFGDDIAFCSHDGGGCVSNDSCDEDSDGTPEGQCIGWLQTGLTAYLLDSSYDAAVSPDVATNYIQLDAVSGGTLSHTVDTGHSLANRTFTFTYSAMTAATTDCTDVSFTIGSADGTDVSAAVTADADGVDYTYATYTAGEWGDYTTTYTFADTTTDTDITVAIASSASCDINIQATSLVEDDEFLGDYNNYQTDNVTYLNDDTVSCEPEDVGCELYVQDGQSEEDGIPGIITNPDSVACVGTCSDTTYTDQTNCEAASATWDATAYNYDAPECSQCNGNPELDQADDYYAGCDFFQEVALDNTVPVTTDETWLTTDQRAGVINRSGKYCQGDSTTHCFEDADCGTGGYCIEQVSIVPPSGESCSLSGVGCEEYTNLAEVEAGGEGLQYFTSLQQCVRTDDQTTSVFYTFEGSDTAGVAVEDHTLKLDTTTGAPCTHLDLEQEDYNADCTDSTDYTATEQSTWDCGPDGDIDGDGNLNGTTDDTTANTDTTTDDEEYGTDADCRQYATADGEVFYRYESAVIPASDDCTPLRNSLDTRVYFALPDSSDSCSVEQVSCREYKGTNSGSEETIIDEDFDDNSTEDWSGATSTSNESILQTGYSLQLQDTATTSTTETAITYDLFITEDTDDDGVDDTTYGLLEGGNSYVLTFWAEVIDSTTTTGATLTAAFDFDTTTAGSDYYFTTAGSSTTSTAITLNPNGEDGWQYYAVGPIVLPEGTTVDAGDETFVLQLTGATTATEAYIDTVILTESNSQYLIQDSSDSCNNFEGCRLYQDRDSNAHYLKSFIRLCGDDVVGCEAMLATQNSANPFTEAYSIDNEYDQDDVIVQYDQPVTLVYNEDNECSSTVMGCTELGLADVDDRTGAIADYSSVYLLDQPDTYTTILCEQPQLSCREYTSTYDGTVYFKDPGEKLCELKEYSISGNTFNGWFKLESEATTPDCPLQYNLSDYVDGYASQPLGGVCNSNSVHHDTDGVTILAEKVGDLCNADSDCYADGWTDDDPTPRCISNLDDDVDLYDGGTHQYVTYPDDGTTLSTEVTDFGWSGVCPDNQSGCSEYIDPYSPNITELIYNWSFEDDVRDSSSNSYYSEDAVADGFPDHWKIPYNATSNTEIDLDADGDVDADDIAVGCDTTDAVITTVSGNNVNPADGVAAVGLTGPCAIEMYNSYPDLAPDKTYTIQAQVKMDPDQLDDGDDTTILESEFSIGVHYYTPSYTLTDGSVIEPQLIVTDEMTLYPVAHEATIDYEEGTDETDSLSYWYRFEGYIGLGTTVPIPTYDDYCSNLTSTTETACTTAGGEWIPGDVAPYASVFLANHSSNTIYFDAVSFKETDKYYYLDYTVDGTAEREQLDGVNTCVDQDTEESEITSDGGCVAFRDMTSDTQNYSQDGLDCTTCLLTPNSDSCRYVVDACDTNGVLKVKRDRVCSEWIACESSESVEDDNGNVTTQCGAIQRCDRLDEDGNCAATVDITVGYDDLSATSDQHFTTAENDTNELSAIRNLTGYSKVGLTWNDILYCNGGPNAGARCTTDTDCEDTVDTTNSGTCSLPFSTEGYYIYAYMQEVGSITSGTDLIEIRDFEELYCAGANANTSQKCVVNATSSDQPGHCYTTTMQQEVESSPDEEPLTPADFVYGADGADSSDDGVLFDTVNDTDLAYCPNSPNFGTGSADAKNWPFGGSAADYEFTSAGWQSTGGTIFVTQYENYQDCPAPCNDIDLNNVLQVGSEGDEAFTGGAQYDLEDNVSEDGTYALTFDARYTSTDFISTDEDSTDNPSTVQICLRHDNIADLDGVELDRKDCFVAGFGAADIVFAIDSSGSMLEEITAAKLAVPDLADQLTAAGIDTQFALIDLDDEDVSGTNTGASYLDLDLTSSVSDFTTAINNMSPEAAYVDPFEGIYDVANNALADSASLTFRPEAQKFLIVITDTGDEISTAYSATGDENNIGSSEAVSAAVEANLPVFIISTDYAECASDSDGSGAPTCTDYYETYAAQMSGAAYDYTNPSDGTTYEDWATNTTIVDDLFDGIISNIDIFQFSTDMETYSLGPLTVTEKDVDETTAQILSGGVETWLEFIGSDNHPFQIDNVSLLPVLEVNKDLNPIARSCRAYPESSSRQCVYAEPSGTQFQGWKGYCLEAEFRSAIEAEEDSSGGFTGAFSQVVRSVSEKPARCITWWPVDILDGETSIVSRDPAGYTGRSSVYHCLVSKGYEHAGFCEEDDYTDSSDDYSTGKCSNTTYTTKSTCEAASETWSGYGQGVICTEDSTCSALGGSCFQGAAYTLPDDGFCTADLFLPYGRAFGITTEADCDAAAAANPSDNYTWYSEFNDLTASYTEDATDVYSDTSYVVRPLKWDMPDPIETAYMDAYDGYLFSTNLHSEEDVPEDNEDIEGSIAVLDGLLVGIKAAAVLGCGGAGIAAALLSGNVVLITACISAIVAASATAPLYAENHSLERGVIIRLPANEILRNIHASEMAGISFNPGNAGSGSDSEDEYQVWGQLNGDTDDQGPYDQSGATDGNSGNIWLTDLLQGAIEYTEITDGTGQPATEVLNKGNCYSYASGSGNEDKMGFGCRVWGLWDSNFQLDSYDGLPELTTDAEDPTGGLDLVYTWVWGNFDWSETENADPDGEPCVPSAGENEIGFDELEGDNINDWDDDDCVETALQAIAGGDLSTDPDSRNLWADIEENYPLWDDFYVDDPTGATTPTITTFTQSDIGGSSHAKIWPDDDQGWDYTGNHDGGNILSLYVDFNDEGYIQAVYVMEYVAAHGTVDRSAVDFDLGLIETTFANRMHLDIQLRESCALVSESVSDSGDQWAWAVRTADGSTYNINDGTTDAYGISETTDPYGSVTPQETNPLEWDFVEPTSTEEFDSYDAWSRLNAQPAFSAAQDTSLSNAGHPLTCLGECDEKVCIGNPSILGEACSDVSDCDDLGVCMGVGDTTISNEGQGTAYTSLDDQLSGASLVASDRLKHVFANITDFYTLSFYNNVTDDTVYNGGPTTIYAEANAAGYWDDSSGNNLYDEMEPCNGDGSSRPEGYGDDEYCGVYPSVDTITIDGDLGSNSGEKTINNGQTVNLSFTSNVDPEQKALKLIYIDWGDESEPWYETWDADTTTHQYTHAYSCGTSNSAYDSGNAWCDYKPKITLVDNWDWCSGTTSGYCTGTEAATEAATEEACSYISGATWTTASATDTTYPIDHRYAEDDGDDVMASCHSYEETTLTIRVDGGS